MKAGLVISFLFIAGLIVWNLMLQKNVSANKTDIQAMKDAITQLKLASVEQTQANNDASKKTDMKGSDLWKELQNSVKEMTVDLTFNKET